MNIRKKWWLYHITEPPSTPHANSFYLRTLWDTLQFKLKRFTMTKGWSYSTPLSHNTLHVYRTYSQVSACKVAKFSAQQLHTYVMKRCYVTIGSVCSSNENWYIYIHIYIYMSIKKSFSIVELCLISFLQMLFFWFFFSFMFNFFDQFCQHASRIWKDSPSCW